MNMTVKFEGHVADVIDRLVEKGVVATKTEALRLGVLRLEADYLKEEEMERKFDEWAVKEVERLDALKKAGKSKIYTQEELDEIMARHDQKNHRNGGLLKNKKRKEP